MSTVKDFLKAAAAKQAERDEAIRHEESLRGRHKQVASELDKAREQREAVETAINNARGGALVAVLTPDVADVLAPEHRRGGCSDGNMGKDDGSCARCTLRRALSTGHLDGRWMFSMEPMP